METFLWHDYETWGINPAVDRPAQFAAIRTDLDLNPIGEPIMIYAKPPKDCLVQPEAVMVTGITPQHAEEHGCSELEFIRQIRQEMMKPGTCSVGYNSIRFDDEVTRNSLYRNFYDPYEREYKNGNSRWDLIDVVRLCHALRPEGFVWPKDDQGLTSFRLEKLTEANGIEQKGAHDALVDVRATIALAQKIREIQPKLFDYALSLKNKQSASKMLKVGSFTPVFHVSSMFSGQNHCCSVVLPVAYHPTNKNEVICFDLRQSPEEFLALDAEELKIRQFSTKETLKALAKERGVEQLSRLPIKNIHINKSPMIAPIKSLDKQLYDRLAIDPNVARSNMQMIIDDSAAIGKAVDLFTGNTGLSHTDPDRMIYSGGFFNNHDKSQFTKIHKSKPEGLAEQVFAFTDIRLPDMLFRFRGRNFPDTLTQEEQVKWKRFCHERITKPEAGASICLKEYKKVIARLLEDKNLSEKKTASIGRFRGLVKSVN